MAEENSLNRKEIIKRRHLGMVGMRKNIPLKIWVNTIGFPSPPTFPKLYLMVEPKP